MLRALMLTLAIAAGTAPAVYDKPESAHWDAQSMAWYVSNVGGSPLEKDGRGWISKLDAQGNVVAAHWVAGLNAPKGIATHASKLYVPDIDQLRIIDLKEGKLVESVPYKGAKFLNDVAVGPDGTVYISDTITSTIHTYRDGKVGVFVEGEAIEHPNGLLVDGGKLVVAAWGPGMDPATFATKEPGRVLVVDLKTGAITPFGNGARVGSLDGIEKYDGGYLVTDNRTGRLYHITAEGGAKLLREGLVNCADIGLDPVRGLLAVPEMGADRVLFFPLKK